MFCENGKLSFEVENILLLLSLGLITKNYAKSLEGHGRIGPTKSASA